MKKLIKFSPNSTKYFEIAEEKYEQGALEHAIYFYYKSYIRRKDLNTLLAIGETYCDMGQPKEGLKYLFLALDSAPGDAEICHSIAQAFLDMEEDEIAFYYFQPHMTMERYSAILEETANDIAYSQPIRVVEKSIDALPSIALKLMNSGDTDYAREILLTIKPSSEHYVAANNILSLTSLEAGNAKEGLEFAQKAMAVKDNIDSRCNMMLAYHFLDDQQNAEKCAEFIESQKLDLSQRKTVSLTYIRMGDAKRAVGHLKILYDASRYNKDNMLSYALALYNTGEVERAKQIVALAAKAYPKDVVIKHTAAAMHRGEQLTLYPLLEDHTANEFLQEIEEKLALASDQNDFFDDESFKEKINWLFQSQIIAGQSKAAGVLGRYKRWRRFFKDCLLDNWLDLSVKKICLYTLLYYGVRGSMGIVIGGLYFLLKIRYPSPMDDIFRAAYCMAYASFAFCDSDFEERLLGTALNLLANYKAAKKDNKIDDPVTLAAVIFFKTGHKKISQTLTCAHLFGCDVSKLEKYLNILKLD